MVKATFDALQSTQSPRMVASRRGMKVAEVLGRRTMEDQDDAANAGDGAAAQE
jgi:small subunit ribosomal protein S5